MNHMHTWNAHHTNASVTPLAHIGQLYTKGITMNTEQTQVAQAVQAMIDPFFVSKDANGRFSVIDQAIKGEDGIYRTWIYKQTLEEVQARYPGAYLMEWEDVHKTQESANAERFSAPAQVITEERFWDMLEVLPPVGWTRGQDSESFKMSERETGFYTGIYARIGKTYYTFIGDTRMTHEQIIERITKDIK